MVHSVSLPRKVDPGKSERINWNPEVGFGKKKDKTRYARESDLETVRLLESSNRMIPQLSKERWNTGLSVLPLDQRIQTGIRRLHFPVRENGEQVHWRRGDPLSSQAGSRPYTGA